jgi:tetratricopeptide (TPR) repeat protein
MTSIHLNRTARLGTGPLCTLLVLFGCGSMAPLGEPTPTAPVSPTAPAASTMAQAAAPPLAANKSPRAWPPPAFPMPTASELAEFAQQQRGAARTAAAQAQHRQAQRSWDILLALLPADAEAKAGFAQATAALRASAAEQLARARAAQARSDPETAVRHYLETLALEPENAAAAEALRALEHQRALRNKPLTFARPLNLANPGAAASPAASPPGPVARGKAAARGAEATPTRTAEPEASELEHAALLASQGDLEAAIALLTPVLRAQSQTSAGPPQAKPAAPKTSLPKGVALKAEPAKTATPQAVTGATVTASTTSTTGATGTTGSKDAAVRAHLADYHFMQAQRWAASNPAAARAALARCLGLVPHHQEARALAAKL